MIEYSVQILSYIAFMAFAAKRLMNYLHALQQEDYDNTRLFRWILMHRVIDRRVSLGFLFLSLIVLVPGNVFFTYTAIFAGFLAAIHFEKDARRQSKKPLVLTARAKRILFSALLPAGVVGLGGFLIPTPLFWILPVQLLPAFLIAANIALQPYERKIQKQFADEARLKLSQMRPTIIGITGSFGKTSVKHILGHILKTAAPTLITPGSVNTLMGITRIIREQLEPNHKFFVVEMGAYGPGSIKTLCDFTPPDLGIISAIGHAHYERFKTLETVAQAKYELAQATLARGGTVIVHEKTLRFPYTLDMRAKNKNNFVAIGEKSKTKDDPSFLLDTDLLIKHIEQNIKGLTILVRWKDKEYVLNAPLFGLHHGHNIALAFAATMTLGIEADDIKAALVRTPQIPHRLEMKHQPDGSIIIDDAYNSNPLGFRSALDLLALLTQTVTGRGILVTPGIVELGSAHDEVHRSLGIYASEVCDIVAIVNPARIPTFIEGYESTGKGKQLQQFDSFAKARDWLIGERKEGDIILLENDLPDLYERVLKI